MSSPHTPERRHPRHPVDLVVVCASASRRVPDRAVNLSRGGACLETGAPLVVGSRHEFLFIVPDAKAQGSVAAVSAVVVWAAERTMGLSFERGAADIGVFLNRLEQPAG